MVFFLDIHNADVYVEMKTLIIHKTIPVNINILLTLKCIYGTPASDNILKIIFAERYAIPEPIGTAVTL